ncbi:type II toxin-antitoxin system HicB family antitoxin [Erythrobacter ani]|uniref:Stability/partitioning determinant n=1 Tax=Erythrobacter ani TaxID=2827235 RepID=A0ABS6SJ15_9SPHN|nr:type II toxin-antitoxin system HicB family antitoxin [Erythrobacter ani]MBV7264989.1 hypothetical protein [Erythrobacter ani]
MSEASFASLNPALLARKGGAKPAMRPQLAPMPQDPAAMAALADEQLEDLGWNDMGQDDADTSIIAGPSDTADILSIASRAANEDGSIGKSPIVRRQQKDLSDRILANAVMDSVGAEHFGELPKAAPKSKSVGKKAKAAVKSGKRAAFTLRLDAERHLKLRLASTMQGISAQALVTEALDTMLEQFSELDALAERMKPN